MPGPDVAAKLAEWRANHVQAVEQLWPEMRGKLDPWQIEGLRYCSQPIREKRLAMSASAGVGKSALEAWEGWIRLGCYGRHGKHPQGVALSIDGKNLRSNLQKEMVLWYGKCDFLQQLFEVTSDEIRSREHPRTWKLEFRSFARSASTEEKAASLSGLHTPYPFALLDETGTMPKEVVYKAEQMFSVMEDGIIVQGGNPQSQKGALYDAVKRRAHLWHAIEITSDPDDPNRCQRIDPDWARAQIEAAALGREDPWVQCYILGKFPESGLNVLLTEDQVEAAMSLAKKKEDFDWAPKVLGVDVAGEGMDESVLCKRQGSIMFPLLPVRGYNSTEGAAWVGRHWAQWGADACFIDAGGGFGGAWRDRLVGHGFQAVQIPFAGKPSDPRYLNKRAEMAWMLREWVLEGGALPRDEKLAEELTTVTYSHHGDRLMLEDKARIKEELKRSPDRMDAAMLTFAMPVAPRPNPYDPIQSIRKPVLKAKAGLPSRRPR